MIIMKKIISNKNNVPVLSSLCLIVFVMFSFSAIVNAEAVTYDMQNQPEQEISDKYATFVPEKVEPFSEVAEWLNTKESDSVSLQTIGNDVPPENKKFIVFRDDDIAPFWSFHTIFNITETFRSHNVPHVMALIPIPFGRDIGSDVILGAYLKSIKNDPHIEFALHGNGHSFNEFGDLSVSEASFRIAEGLEIIETLTGIRPVTFTPPYHAYNNNTLVALRENNVNIISSGTDDIYRGVAFREVDNITHLPATTDFYNWDEERYNTADEIKTSCEYAMSVYDMCVILLHHHQFNTDGRPDPSKIQVLTDVLDWAKEKENSGATEIVRFMDLIAVPSTPHFNVTISSPTPQTSYYVDAIDLNVTASEVLLNLSYNIDSGDEILLCSDCNASNSILNLSLLNDGIHTLSIVAVNYSMTQVSESVVFNLDLCVPDWYEVNTTCHPNDILTGYYIDSNNCYAQTNLESDNEIPGNNTYDCDFCLPHWTEINTTCHPNDVLTGYYIDNNNCYAQTNLESDNEIPGNNTYDCDFCLPHWTEINTTCHPNDILTGYYIDNNNCSALTNLESDNQIPVNNTYSCDYCIPDWACSEYGECSENGTQPCISFEDQNSCYAQTNLDSDNEIPQNVNRTCNQIPPVVIINEPEAIEYMSQYVTLNVSTDVVADCSYTLNGGGSIVLFQDTHSGVQIITAQLGVNTLNMSCTDIYGNRNDSAFVLFDVVRAVYENSVDFVSDVVMSINSPSNDTVLEISTNGNLSNSSINITESLFNPTNSSFGVVEIGKYIRIEADEKLDSNITSALIRIFYEKEELGLNVDESSLAVYWFNESAAEWVKLHEAMDWVYGAGVNTTANYVWANVSHFSTYGVGGQKQDGGSCLSALECIGGNCVHGVCRSHETYCGDSYCDSGETCSTCNVDCGDCYSKGGSNSGTVVPPKDVNITLIESVDEMPVEKGQIKTDIIPDTMDDVVRQGNPGELKDMQQGELDKVKHPRVITNVNNEDESESNGLVAPTGAYLQSYSYPIFVVVAIAIILLVYLFVKSRKSADKYRNSRQNPKQIQFCK